MKKVSFLFILFINVYNSFSQDYSLFKSKIYIFGTDTLAYKILYPLNYDTSKKYPLVLFLHGAGQRGKDNSKQLTHGAGLFSGNENRNKFPAIVIFPQCGRNDFWARTRVIRLMTDSTPVKFEYLTDVPMNKGLNLVSHLLDSLSATQNINNKQIYIGGLSMGGMGTFELLWRKPAFFAAAFSMSGGGNTEKVPLYGRDLPVWIFHGDMDPLVDVNDSRKMAEALKAADAKVKYTEYHGVKHDSWKKAFAEPQLLPWLFSQRRS